MSLIQTLLDPIEEIKQQFSNEANNQEDNDKNETINKTTPKKTGRKTPIFSINLPKIGSLELFAAICKSVCPFLLTISNRIFLGI